MAKVLVTGASGFIAKHIVLQLLQNGHTVIGSLRSPKRQAEVRSAIASHMAEDSDWQDRLLFVTLDLSQDSGWQTALQGVDALIHTASPFPLVQPKDEADLIRPAVDGTLRALRAAQANGVNRVILTSSAVAVMHCDLPQGRSVYDETDWSQADHPTMSPYGRSKLLAERAAWEFVQQDAPDMMLTTINPTLVTGVPLDRHYGSSVEVIERILRGKDPMVPQVGIAVVDVVDVAAMHVAALKRPAETAGMRFLATSGFLWFKDMADAVREAYPTRRIAKRVAPNWLIRIMGRFDPAIKSIVPLLGRRFEISNARARQVMGIAFIPPRRSIRDTATFLVESDLV